MSPWMTRLREQRTRLCTSKSILTAPEVEVPATELLVKGWVWDNRPSSCRAQCKWSIANLRRDREPEWSLTEIAYISLVATRAKVAHTSMIFFSTRLKRSSGMKLDRRLSITLKTFKVQHIWCHLQLITRLVSISATAQELIGQPLLIARWATWKWIRRAETMVKAPKIQLAHLIRYLRPEPITLLLGIRIGSTSTAVGTKCKFLRIFMSIRLWVTSGSKYSTTLTQTVTL